MEASRKAAIRAYKEIKPARGIFLVRCTATKSLWVDSAMDLRAAENRLWSSLPSGDPHIEKTIFAEFQTHGREAFAFEILEKFKDDIGPVALRDLLKERKRHWLTQTSARPLSPV